MNQEIASRIAAAIKTRIDNSTDSRITHATISTSFALHIALEAIADELQVHPTTFKKDCGVGQPLAYFI